ncbi:hypothetical protein L7F22_060819 [Adiantum nelumboides]|nr:hypothetical protein [Adiantum nelumboides]
MDVNNAFPNGLLEEEVYMQQPEGYVVAWKESMVCKLNKSLDGLKQAPRAWYGRIDNHLQSQEFQRSNADHTLYYKVQGKDNVLVRFYVNDLILTGSNDAMVEDVQSKLSKEFEMKDLGELHYILGIEVSRLKKGDIFISQQKYLHSILDNFDMISSKPVFTSMESTLKLTKDEHGVLYDTTLYRQLIRSLSIGSSYVLLST